MNTFELAVELAVEGQGEIVDQGFLVSRRDQCELASCVVIYKAVAYWLGLQTNRCFRRWNLLGGTQWRFILLHVISRFMNK